MKKNICYLLALFSAALVLVGHLWAQDTKPASQGAPPNRWQHMAIEQDATLGIRDPEMARKINQLGTEGWELVDVEGVLESGTTSRRIFYFKRSF